MRVLQEDAAIEKFCLFALDVSESEVKGMTSFLLSHVLSTNTASKISQLMSSFEDKKQAQPAVSIVYLLSHLIRLQYNDMVCDQYC